MLTPLHRRIVKRAIELLEGGWTRGTLARDKNGYEVAVTSSKAARFCMYGALRRAAWEERPDDPPLLRPILLTIGGSITSFNDHHARSKKQVIERLEKLL